MPATRPADLDQYGVILYTCMWHSGMTIMPVGYRDITPDAPTIRPVQSTQWRAPARLASVLRLLLTGRVTIREDELE